MIRALSALFMTALVADLTRAVFLYEFTLFCYRKNSEDLDCDKGTIYSGSYVMVINWLLTVFLASNSVAYWLFSFKYFIIA